MTNEAQIDIRVDDSQVEGLTRSLGNLQRAATTTATGFNTLERESSQAKEDVNRLSRSVQTLDRNLGSMSRGLRAGGSSLASIGRIAAGTALGVAGLDSAVAAIQKTVELATSSVAAYAQQNAQLQTSLTNLQETSGRAQLALGRLITEALGGVEAFEAFEDIAQEFVLALEVLAEAFGDNSNAVDDLNVSARSISSVLYGLYEALQTTYSGAVLLGGALRLLIPRDNYGLGEFNETLARLQLRMIPIIQRGRRIRNEFDDLATAARSSREEVDGLNRSLGGTRGSLGSLEGATITLQMGDERGEEFTSETAREQVSEIIQTYARAFKEADIPFQRLLVKVANTYFDIGEGLAGQAGINTMADIFLGSQEELDERARQLERLRDYAEQFQDIPGRLEENEERRLELEQELEGLRQQRAREQAAEAEAQQRALEAAQERLEAEQQNARALREQAQLTEQIAQNAREEAQRVVPRDVLPSAVVGGMLVPTGGAAGAQGLALAGRSGLLGNMASGLFSRGLLTMGGAQVAADAVGALGTGFSRLAGPVGIGAGIVGGGASGYSRRVDEINAEQNRNFATLIEYQQTARRAVEERAQAEDAALRVAQAQLEVQNLQNQGRETQSEIDGRIAILGLSLIDNERERQRLLWAQNQGLDRYEQALESINDLGREGLDIQRAQGDEAARQLASGVGADVGEGIVEQARGIASTRVPGPSTRVLRTGFGFRADRDRTSALQAVEEGEYTSQIEGLKALSAALNDNERAYAAAVGGVEQYMKATSKMKQETRDAFRTEGINTFEESFITLGTTVGTAIAGGFDDGLTSAERGKKMLFELLGSTLQALGATAIAQGAMVAFGDPLIGGFPNPVRAAGLIAAGTAAVVAGSAFSAKAGGIGGGGKEDVPTPTPASTAPSGGGGTATATTNIFVENRFGSRFDAREMDRAAAGSFRNAIQMGQA